MSLPKKKAVTKSVNRPCKIEGPSDAVMTALASYTRPMKNGSNGRITKARSKKGNHAFSFLHADDDDDDDDGPSSARSMSNGSDDRDSHDGDSDGNSDGNFDIAEGSDDEYTVGNKTKAKGAGKRKQKAKANIKTNTKANAKKDGTAPDPHGRVKGRDLIPWTRPRMFEKLILHLQYEAEVAGIKLPWNAAVNRLHVGSNEGAATQQLAKLREILLTEGHMVPPKAKVKNKRGLEYSPQIRGYIRPDGAGPYETRLVGWGESIVDLTESIENPGIYRGSGRYPRKNGVGQAMHCDGSKPSLTVTLKLNPTHLAKFPAGTGKVQPISDIQPVNDAQPVNDPQAVHHREGKNHITKQDDFEGGGEEFDSDNDDAADQNARVAIVKTEGLDDHGADADNKGIANEVDGYMPYHTQNWLNGGLARTLNPSTSSNGLYDAERMGSFHPAVGVNASHNGFGAFAGFNPSAGGFTGHHVVYSPGVINEYNTYNGSSMIGSNSYVAPAALSMGLAMTVGHGYGMGMPTQLHPSYPHYEGSNMDHASIVGTTQSLAEPSSRGAPTVTGDQSYSGRGPSADLNAPDLMDATDNAVESSEEDSYDVVEGSGEEDGYDVNDFLNHGIFSTSD